MVLWSKSAGISKAVLSPWDPKVVRRYGDGSSFDSGSTKEGRRDALQHGKRNLITGFLDTFQDYESWLAHMKFTPEQIRRNVAFEKLIRPR